MAAGVSLSVVVNFTVAFYVFGMRIVFVVRAVKMLQSAVTAFVIAVLVMRSAANGAVNNLVVTEKLGFAVYALFFVLAHAWGSFSVICSSPNEKIS